LRELINDTVSDSILKDSRFKKKQATEEEIFKAVVLNSDY